VRLKDIVCASKDDIKVGQWRSGKVPRNDFPMAKSAYGLGSSFRWCVISFEALGVECRVLVVVNAPKQKYEAVLGVMASNGLRILCTYEYHATEPGWHCHATHDDTDTLTIGCMRGPWIRRVPGARKNHRQTKFSNFQIADNDTAIRFAVSRYRIWSKGPLL
jgi:hypothetical protein